MAKDCLGERWNFLHLLWSTLNSCAAAAHLFDEIYFQVEHVTSELSLAAFISSLLGQYVP